MRALVDKKKEAILLRSQGFTYSEIVSRLQVSKASLSLWIKDVILPDSYFRKIEHKKFIAHHKAKISNRTRRLLRSSEVIKQARLEVDEINYQELLYIGVMLYWAEGSKQKAHNVSEGVTFGNTDVEMMKIFLIWLKEVCSVDLVDSCTYELFIHESADYLRARMVWAQELGISGSYIRVRFKRHRLDTNRRININTYKGLVRVHVKKSTDLNRRIQGLTQEISMRILKCHIT